jgi:predicted RNA-binding protein YlqC (UPF0109 family)
MLDRALAHLVGGIVEHPDEVSVTAVEGNRGETLEIRVIGRGGRTAKALRTVITALSGGKRVRVDVVDPES